MSAVSSTTCLFLDIGGVLLSNGWDRAARTRASRKFDLEPIEFESRHQMTFGTYEEGRLNLEEYLEHVIFYKKRNFTPTQFRKFMFAQSTPEPEMLSLMRKLKSDHRLKIIAVSNEARELNSHRIHRFKLNELIDAFVSSCFFHVRKPDPEILRIALDVAQVPIGQILYIENTPMFVEIAKRLGIPSLLHTDFSMTRAELASLGLEKKPEFRHVRA